MLVSRVKALAEALEGSDVSELDLTEDGLRIHIKRQVEPLMALAPLPAHNARPARSAARRRAAANHAGGAAHEEPKVEPGIAVLAPLTGVFYNAPSPTSSPFVAVGEPVQAGQVVAIVPKNGQLVQKGEALIRVQAS